MMSKEVTFPNMPMTLDPDEMPFVLGWGTDRRRSLRAEGGNYRRGPDRFVLEIPVTGTLRAQALGWLAGDDCMVVACLGTLFNDWWPLLQSSPADATRPVLSAAARDKAVTMSREDVTLRLNVFMTPEPELLTVGTKLHGGFTAENVLLIRYMAVPVIKAALLAISEYVSLASPIPEAQIVQRRGVPGTLADVVDAAKSVADSIDWQFAGQ
jgi:hypothetical protein